MLCREFETYGNTACVFSDFVGKIPKLFDAVPLRKTRRGNRSRTGFEVTYFRNFSFYFITRKVASGSRFGALPSLEMEGLTLLYLLPGEAESSRG
jgi:hypothetical protein